MDDLKKQLAARAGDVQRINELEGATKKLVWRIKELDNTHSHDRQRFEASCIKMNKESWRVDLMPYR